MIRLVPSARERAHERFGLDALPPNRRAWPAQTGRQQTNQALARMAPERRYPVLMAFCVEALERTTDDAIETMNALGEKPGSQRRLDGTERLETLGEEQQELLDRLAREQATTAEAQLADSGLVVDGPEIV